MEAADESTPTTPQSAGPTDARATISDEERARIVAALKITAPPPERSGELRIRRNGKWLQTHVVLVDGKLYFSVKSKGTMKPTILPLRGCIVRPAEASEVPKDDYELSFSVRKDASEGYFFAAESKEARGQWVKAVTMAALNLRAEELGAQQQYDFGVAPKQRMALPGFDQDGNTVVLESTDEDTDEQQRIRAMLPSNEMIDIMAGRKKYGTLRGLLAKLPSKDQLFGSGS